MLEETLQGTLNFLSKITTHLLKTSNSPDPIFILIGLLEVCIHVLNLSQNTKTARQTVY